MIGESEEGQGKESFKESNGPNDTTTEGNNRDNEENRMETAPHSELDLTVTVMEGWMDKCGQSLVRSKWTHRWCVLNGNSFVYFVDESKSAQKGAYIIDESCRIVSSGFDKKKAGGRENVISLQKPGTISGGGYELLLSCEENELLQVWESALSSVIATLRQIKEAESIQRKPRLSVILDTIIDATTSTTSPVEDAGEMKKKTVEKRPSFFRRRSTLKASRSGSIAGKGLANDVSIDTSELMKTAVKDGRVLKRNDGEPEYSNDFCVLSSASLAFFSDSSLQESKGVVLLDSSYHLTSLTCDKKQKSSTNSHFLSLHTRGTGKNFTSKTSELMLSFPSDELRHSWDEKIYYCLCEHLHKVYDVVVRVQQYFDNEGITAKIEEPIFKISLLVSSKTVLEQYHHYTDIREVYTKLKSLSSGIITAIFPKNHKRSAFNIKLNEDEIENRIIGLQNWLQDLVTHYSKFDYLNFIGDVNDVQVDIAAIFGTDTNSLKAFIKEARDKKAQAIAPPPLPKSKVMSLFAKYGEEDDDVPPPVTVELQQKIVENSVGNDDDIRMPSSPDKLVLYNIMQLAKLCKKHEVECMDFKCKKNYINALASTYQKALPYLHNKEARPVVENIIQTLEYKPLSINDDAMNIEIDKIFVDLMRKMNVAEGLLGLLSMEFNTFEKLDRIQWCVAVWDADMYFTAEDRALLVKFSSDRLLDSFSVLNLKTRMKSATGEGSSIWLQQWCAQRGLSALITRIDSILEHPPLLEVDAVNLLLILQIFRSIVETDCRYELVGTRGAIEALVMTVNFEYKSLAVEALKLLSEIIIFGGDGAVWQMINGFERLAFVRKEDFLKVLVDGVLEQDITIQCPVLSLINSMLLYEGDITTRIKIRRQLHILKFDAICSVFKKEYMRMSKLSQSNNRSDIITGLGSCEDQIRDKIDRLLFGGARFTKSEMKQEDVEPEFFQENCREMQLRPGIKMREYDFGPNLAEDFYTGVHPEMGIMEGHMVAISKKSDEDDARGFQSWEGVVKKVAKRLSFTEAKPLPCDDVNKYERSWYELHDNLLSWYNLADKTDSFRERTGCLDISRVCDILDFSTLTTKVTVPLQNMFSLVLCDEEEHVHLYTDSLETKHKWMLAVRVVQKRMSLRKCAYRLPVTIPLESTVTLKLQKDFEALFTIYESVAKEDVVVIYSSTINDILNPAGATLSHDAVDLVQFIDLELKKHNNSNKLRQLLTDIAEFVNENYAPKEEVPDEEEEEEVKIIHPLAVPDSDRPIAQAPPLPFIPTDKAPRIPNKKVKQLFWTKVKPVNVWKSVWEGMEEPELSWSTLDEQFGEIVRRRKAIIANNAEITVDSKPKLISLFDGKRTQNAAIACGKLRKSPEEIFDMIVNMDQDELTQEINDTILNLLLPTNDEIAALRAYTGKVEDLDFCGRLFSYLSEIERLEQRLRVQHVMLSWNSEAGVVFDQVNTIKLALEELNDPEALESFETILACVLAAGNYMNGKSNRGQAHGYKLDILPKLRNIKQVSFGKKTFLHFIIGQSQLHFPNQKAFYDKWNFMWKSPKIILKNLENIVVELKENLDICVAEIEVAETIESEQCRIPLFENLGSFITQASETLQELHKLFEDIDKDVRSCKNYFGETSVAAVLTSRDDDPWCNFFSLFVNFANMHRLCSVELEEWNKADERIRKKAAEREKKLSSKNYGSKQKKITSINRDEDNIALSQMIARERGSSIESNSSVDRRARQVSSEDNVIDMFKKKMLVIRKTADAVTDEGAMDSDDSDDGAW